MVPAWAWRPWGGQAGVREGRPMSRRVESLAGRRQRERGNAGLGYIAIALIAALVCSSVVTTVPMARVTATVRCAVDSIVNLKWMMDGCVDAALTGNPGQPTTPGNPPTPPGGTPSTPPDPNGGHPPTSCDDPVYGPYNALPDRIVGQSKSVNHVTTDANPRMVRFDCVWYYIPTDCGAPPSGWSEGLTPNAGVDIAPFRSCVTSGRGEATPKESDNPECSNTMPAGMQPGQADGARVQIGCAIYVVPQECSAQWSSYVDADSGAGHLSGAAPTVTAGVDLAKCILNTYNKLEADCAVWSQGNTATKTTQILFWKWSKSDGMVVEKLGDGRYKVTLAHGKGKGAGIEFNLSAGNATASAGLWGMSGVDQTDVYEFANETDAQAWLDWYKEYDAADKTVADLDRKYGCYSKKTCTSKRDSGPTCMRYGMCDNGHINYPESARTLRDLQQREPDHKRASQGWADTTEVTVDLSVGAKSGKGKGEGEKSGATPSLEASLSYSHSSKSAVSQVTRPDGSHSASWSTSSMNGIAALVSFGLASPTALEGVGKLQGNFAKEWKGGTTITATWDKDGTLTALSYRLDKEALTSVKKGISLGANYGLLGASVSLTQTDSDGTATVLENRIDFTLHPELREQYQTIADESFPGGSRGALDGNHVRFSVQESEEQLESLQEAAKQGATRSLEYEVDKSETTKEVGVTFGGLVLAKANWTTTSDERNLSSSSLEVTDVNGTRQTVDPAPKCYLPTFDKPEDYYPGSSSNVSTSSHPYDQGYDFSHSTTPID